MSLFRRRVWTVEEIVLSLVPDIDLQGPSIVYLLFCVEVFSREEK